MVNDGHGAVYQTRAQAPDGDPRRPSLRCVEQELVTTVQRMVSETSRS